MNGQPPADLRETNNFNLIRIYLSLSVVFFHIAELSNEGALSFLYKFFNGERAVEAFFIISGYLIIRSYERSRSLKDYFSKRFRRIYPAYILIILLSAFGGVLLTTMPVLSYFTSVAWFKYVGANLIFLNFIQPWLPGVFEQNTFTAVNGSLWTLKIEVGYYVLVPLIVYLRSRINNHLLYAFLFLGSISYFLYLKGLYQSTHRDLYLFLSRQVPGQLFYFIAGAWIATLEKYALFRKALLWLGFPAFLSLFLPIGTLAKTIALALSIFFFAKTVPTLRYRYMKEDISYGLYIYHFPVIQVLVALGIFQSSPYSGLLVSLIITITLAMLSWTLIEKPFLSRKDKKAEPRMKAKEGEDMVHLPAKP